jgi:hypothetical protein
VTDVVTDDGGFGAVENDEIPPVRDRESLGGGCAGFLVVNFAVNDRRETVLGVLSDSIPHIEHGPACCIDHRASETNVLLELSSSHAERWNDDNGLSTEAISVFARIAQEPDAGGPQVPVDVRVVDDFAREVDRTFRKATPCLVRVVDGPIDPVAEAELAGEVDGQAAGRVLVCGVLDIVDDPAVIVLRQLCGDRVFETESFSKH